MPTENERTPQVGGEGVLKDVAPKLEGSYLQEMEADQDAYIGVKAAGAASKVYGRRSKWLIVLGYESKFDSPSKNSYSVTRDHRLGGL